MMLMNSVQRTQFNLLVASFRDKKPGLLFTKDGNRHRSNSFAAHFWAGYDGIDGGLFQPRSRVYRSGAGYIFYLAGKHCRETLTEELDI
jgi:hypothetical protein